MKVVHVISGLRIGGAETMLYRLLRASIHPTIQSEVVSLTEVGRIGRKIEALGVPVRGVDLSRGALRIARLAAWLRRSGADLVQTWLHHADLIGGLAARAVTRAPVVWNIRHSSYPRTDGRIATPWPVALCARLSHRLPARIVCCSEASRRSHARLGYATERMVVIPNGFDLARFRPDPAARAEVRRELGVPDAAPLIGVIGRYRREKDHENFLAAATRLRTRIPAARFLLCGPEVGWNNPKLAGAVLTAGLKDNVTLLGWRDDVFRIDAALDVACSSSASEGFSNAIGEAMACGVPCVATDVGDSSHILGATGRIVPPGDSVALAEAIGELVAAGPDVRRRMGEAARERVAALFSLPAVVHRYESLYEEVCSAAAPSAREPAPCSAWPPPPPVRRRAPLR